MRITQATKKEQRIIPALLAMMLASAATASFAAGETASVKVVGTISPAACQISVGNNGVFDFGTISGFTLSQNDFTKMGPKQLNLSIICSSATKVAILSADNRISSTLNTVMPFHGMGDLKGTNYGLGMTAGNQSIGVYNLRLEPDTFTADAQNVRPFLANDIAPDMNWVYFADKAEGLMMKGRYMTWGPANSKTPLAFTTLSGKISAYIAINKASLLPLSNTIPLDGSATLQIVYLP